ncbi:MAG: UDP-N-acetylmuramate dehydrogenase [Armatimonadota bacterium]|nr:UDP-N-acetylmuramate dehydrogenase [Armatimonadota bacterium]MDR7402592.1 UDP-N-acetylmuramate dehydrogenase [Armatimonadota bacterium]MDR7404041.1 UDP-N-acetylmuramate dehydrogenase [Armatimonadota bacterium]MDR7436806.1 UDP-N-acetylmuramate dehydrogenase [Armatimonadota bacterium]MDR7472753.1 UDP-N-acetylmuramate dehydrogenase [Armatimonadota bacterium]
MSALPSRVEVARRLRALCRDVRENEPLARHVSFRIGGPADVLAVPRSVRELRAVVRWLFDAGLPFVVLGQGSNVLIADAGIRAVVLKIGKGLDGVAFDGGRVTAQAGAGLPFLARAAAARGLAGLEFAAGIPASVGGAVVMNAGAHGHAMAEVVRSVRVLQPDGERVLAAAELAYGYRTSALQRQVGVVVEATLQLRQGDPAAVRELTDRWLAQRAATQPLGPPSSGCVFRNPPGDHAGRLIDLAGGKGLQVGGARVSEVHANYILNTGAATAADVLALMRQVSGLVMEKFGVRLEPEIKLVGEFDPDQLT